VMFFPFYGIKFIKRVFLDVWFSKKFLFGSGAVILGLIGFDCSSVAKICISGLNLDSGLKYLLLKRLDTSARFILISLSARLM